MNHSILLDNYSPAADFVVTAICFVMIILLAVSYVSRTRSSVLFLSMVGLVLAAAWTDILFYTLAVKPDHLPISARSHTIRIQGSIFCLPMSFLRPYCWQISSPRHRDPPFISSKRGSALCGGASSSMPISAFSYCAFFLWQG